MEEDKKGKILDAATEAFAKYGYAQATIENISKKSKVATSMIYFYFKGGKLEIMLSIFIRFWTNINNAIYSQLALLSNPHEKLACIINTVYAELTKDYKALCLSKVLNEHLPFFLSDKSATLKEKRQKISEENNKLIVAIDAVILDGQKQGIFFKDVAVGAIRQMLYGCIQNLIYGCYLQDSKIVKNAGYTKDQAMNGVNKMISRFLIADDAVEFKNIDVISIL